VVDVYAISIDEEISGEKLNKLLSAISEEKRERISCFRFKRDILRSMYGELLVRYIVSKRKRIDFDDIKFVYNTYGKPYIKDISDLYFNVSHSGKWVACAFGQMEVGIDIELIRDIDIEIARDFLAPPEYDSLMKRTDYARLEYFYDLWTLKESYIKWTGKGLSIPLSSFRIVQCNSSSEIRVFNNEKVRLKQFLLDKEYKMSVCSEESCINEPVILSADFIENVTG